MALYLTYRPNTFDELVKQEHITNILKPKVASNDKSHSNYLFYWPRGTGKTSTARIFAKALNCTNLQDGNPCNSCDSCVSINTNRTVDVVEIDAASHTGVDNVREEIISKAPYPPSHLKKKVYIIDEVHMLSKPAFNALLKIMEEPPEYLVFILATTEIHKVPETIISRCQIFTFKKIPVEDLVKHLTMICEKEKFTYSNEALVSIAKIADGCARDAIKYLDQVSILGDISQSNITSFLGVASDQLVQSFLALTIQKDTTWVFAVIDSLHETWVDINNFIKQCLVYIEEHFSENIEWYIVCTDVLKRVLYWLKNFPLPTILMKMEIYNAFNASAPTNTPAVTPKTPSKTMAVSAPKEPVAIATPTPPNETIVTKEVIPPTESKPQPIISNQWEVWWVLWQVANHWDIKPNIKSILEKSCILEYEDGKWILYIFNKLQWSIIQKADNRTAIEKVFKKVTWSENWLQMVVTTKEEYMTMKL